MAIDDELRAQILRYHFVEHRRVGTIASQLGIHHSIVEWVSGEAEVERERRRRRRPSKLDPCMGLITGTLERFPTLTAARLLDMARARGHTGGPDHFRHRIAQLRPHRPREASLRLRTPPGGQARVDRAHFGTAATTESMSDKPNSGQTPTPVLNRHRRPGSPEARSDDRDLSALPPSRQQRVITFAGIPKHWLSHIDGQEIGERSLA